MILQNKIIHRYAIAIGLTALAMAWLAPLESSVWMTTLDRYLFWFLAVSMGWLQMIIIAYGVRSTFASLQYPGWCLLFIASVIGAIPITFEVRFLWGLLKLPEGPSSPYWMSYATAVFININFSLLQWMFVENWSLQKASTPLPYVTQTTSENIKPTVEMLSRKPDKLSGEIICLKIEDHYLRVYTQEGNDIILHRMADAVRELMGTDGKQVHRSWWVSKQAVINSTTRNNRRFLCLSNGEEAPVSRSYLPHLKADQWF